MALGDGCPPGSERRLARTAWRLVPLPRSQGCRFGTSEPSVVSSQSARQAAQPPVRAPSCSRRVRRRTRSQRHDRGRSRAGGRRSSPVALLRLRTRVDSQDSQPNPSGHRLPSLQPSGDRPAIRAPHSRQQLRRPPSRIDGVLYRELDAPRGESDSAASQQHRPVPVALPALRGAVGEHTALIEQAAGFGLSPVLQCSHSGRAA